MNTYANLWNEISSDICSKYNVPHSYFFEKEQLGRSDVLIARNHAYLILMLELVLQEHRDKYSLPFEKLSGSAALHHKIFLKTKWLPQVIRDLCYEDCLFVLLEDLRPENLSAEAQSFLKNIEAQKFVFEPNKPLLEGWTPEKYELQVKHLAQNIR
ncbi:hypothetical protein RSJ44_004434 [Yersinia enterocolitica]|uniref:Uncharacterized protein n=1 Tax=Yersinia bercovieri TaxID=634 RepID=A0A2G4U410_YERBE|nr:hypothetical protein [Yersinia enterocolitica]MBW5815845.1 hypothetical protein [Yersinia kristensenii]PHZ28048.1 hypothetical protein CS533_07260 [Yersinia bercovieri]QDW32859.1 hypothetical protein FFE93_007175 [Yersinia sp. KBS0713]EKN4866896.1 hypothetical protein [Yersinia enterocolitica]